MASWILPGRKNDPVMRYKAILETSFAFSRTFNPRNIEHHWYSLWAQTLSDLVADIPNLIVAPQFPIWFVPEDDDHEAEDEDDGDDPEEIASPVQLNSKKQEAPRRQVDGEERGVGGAGDISVAFTVPEQDAKSVFVDFVILNLKAAALPLAQPEHRIRYGGWRITAANVGLLIEVKRLASRSLTGQEQKARILARIVEASMDLIDQAAHLFIQDQNRDSVLALAAAGPYWRSARIYRNNIKRAMHRFGAKDPSYQASNEQLLDKEPNWNIVLRVDLASSRERLHRIYTTLERMGVLEIPADV